MQRYGGARRARSFSVLQVRKPGRGELRATMGRCVLTIQASLIYWERMSPTQDLHVKEIVRLSPPNSIKAHAPMTEEANRTVVNGRQAIQAILDQRDPRLLVVIGPCSIHDVQGTM